MVRAPSRLALRPRRDPARRGHAIARLLLVLGGSALGGGIGCAGAAPPPAPIKPPPVVNESLSPVIVSPARWDFHPPVPDRALASARLGAAGCAFTAEGGQRWLGVDPAAKGAPSTEPVCSGKAEASSFLAPEDLTSVIRRGEKSFVFVGVSGTLYTATEALGSFGRIVPPPEPFSRVSGAGAHVLGTTYEGKVHRWDEASGWRPVTITTPGQKVAPRLFDVVVNEAGRALALAFPEALFTSEDGGATWAPLAAPMIGARSVGLTAEGNLGVEGLLESIELRPQMSPPLRRIQDALPAPSSTLEVTAGRGPSAGAVLSGRAAIDGDRYMEVIRPDSEGDPWQLAKGRIEGRIEATPLAGSDACTSLRVGLRGKTVVTVCSHPTDSDLAADVRFSSDLGVTFGDPLELTATDADAITLAVSPSGSALVGGVCRPAAPESGQSCHPSVPLLIRAETSAPGAGSPDAGSPDAGSPDAGSLDAGSVNAATPSAAKLKVISISGAQISGVALAPAFSMDGHSAYFLGKRGKDDRFSLFASHDGGETFSPRPLDAPNAKVARRPPRSDDEEERESEPEVGDDTLDVDDSTFLRPGEDGTIGLLMTRSRGSAYVTLDEDGRVLRVAVPPIDEAMISGFGRRVVATFLAEGREQNIVFWESSDGGATWEEQAGSGTLGRELSRGMPPLVCSASGCLFGEQISRVGWGGQAEGGVTDRVPPSPPSMSPSVLTPIVCELAPKAGWARIEQANPVGSQVVMSFPGVDEAMRGRSVWSVLTETANGALRTVSATLPEGNDGEPVIVSRQMLGPRPSGASASDVSRQMEGYAAVRVGYPTEKDGSVKPGAPMKNLEVGWENYMEGSLGHGTIPDAGLFERNDLDLADGAHALDTSLITVTTRGIILTPHGPRARNRATFFLDLTGKVDRFEPPTFPSSGLAGLLDLRNDAVVAEGQLLGVGVVRDRSVPDETLGLLLARRAPGPGPTRWEISAESLLPAHTGETPLEIHSDWTYSGKTTIGVTSLIVDRSKRRSWGTFLPFRGDGTLGPPEPLATLLDLGDRPRPCTTAERASTPRFESRFFSGSEALFPGMRHPVLVTEPPTTPGALPGLPIVLLTAAAVTHGPPASPCVAAWDARGLARAPIAAIVGGNPARSWLFRPFQVPTGGRATAPAVGLEYRPMTCHFDPGAHVPDAVMIEPGTATLDP